MTLSPTPLDAHRVSSGFHATGDAERIFKQCTRFLSYHDMHDPAELIGLLQASGADRWRFGQFGADASTALLENRVAEILGKQAALFFPTGTMAQLAALRIWTNRTRCNGVAWHPTCHLNAAEGQQGYAFVLGLRAAQLGHPLEVTSATDFSAYPDRLGAVVIESPLRQLGGKVVPWDELVALRTWSREVGTPIHMDGARLFETEPYYGRPLATICANVDSVFVSAYKILGGFGGAVLAGDAGFVSAAALWRRRLGGDLYRVFPYVVSALRGLEVRLPRVPLYQAKAVSIANALRGRADVVVTPDPPEACMMHVCVRAEPSRLQEAGLAVAERTGAWLFHTTRTSRFQGFALFELCVGDATLEFGDDEIVDLFDMLLEEVDRAH